MIGELSLPAGYTVWGNAKLTPAMVAWAHEIEHKTRDGDGHYGEIFHAVIDGVPVAGRVEHHTYTYDAQGKMIPCPPGGCHGVSLYHPPAGVPVSYMPQGGAPASQASSPRTMDWILFGASIFGVVLTASLTLLRARKAARVARQR